MPTIRTQADQWQTHVVLDSSDLGVAPRPKPYLSTPLQKFFRAMHAEGLNKTERKLRFKQYVSDVVDEIDRPSGRLGDHVFDAAAYSLERAKLKSMGAVITGLIKDDFTDAQLVEFRQLTDSVRRDIFSMVLDACTDDRKLTSGENRKFFFCASSHFVTKTAEAKYSRFHNCWISPDAWGMGNYVKSKAMDDYLSHDVAQRFYTSAEGIRVGAFDWVTNDYAADNGFQWVERHSGWLPLEVFEAMGYTLFSPGNDGPIGGYHSSRQVVGKIPSKMYDSRKPPLRMGLELEMENATANQHSSDLALAWLKKFAIVEIDGRKYRYCACEHDGSLNNGFECVTGYTGIDVHAHALAALKDNPFKGKLKSHDTTTCGLHVHIDRANITPLHAYKLNLFVNAKENLTLIHAIARRYNHDRYAAMAPKHGDSRVMGDYVRRVRDDLIQRKGVDNRKTRQEFSQLMKTRYREVIATANGTRYQAINFSNRNTVEFRLFRGSLKYETVMSCLEFTRAAWLFSYERSKAEMTSAEFLKFICRDDNRQDTKYLREYLTLKGFDTKERTVYTLPDKRLSQAMVEAEDAALGLPKPKANKLYQPQAVAA